MLPRAAAPGHVLLQRRLSQLPHARPGLVPSWVPNAAAGQPRGCPPTTDIHPPLLPDPRVAPHSRGFAAAAPAAALPVDGDLSGVLRAIDAAVSAEGAGPKDVADAAMGLAFLQARGDRRCDGATGPGTDRPRAPRPRSSGAAPVAGGGGQQLARAA
jgi:hypothetical protein